MILDTPRLASINYLRYEYKQTWAEKRKEELIWRLKKKKS